MGSGNQSLSCGKSAYRIGEFSQHRRIAELILESSSLETFHVRSSELTAQRLEYVPFLRYAAAERLVETLGEELQHEICSVLHDRERGCLLARTSSSDPDRCIAFATAIAHLVGIPNFDAMDQRYYARFVVQHVDRSDSYLRKPYITMTLHTDGTYVDEPTDWVLMMKLAERGAVGGRSRLLHLDDWESLDAYRSHPLASVPIEYKAPPSKNVSSPVWRQTFEEREDGTRMAFIDQFAQPRTMEMGSYLMRMSSSMENSAGTRLVELPVGSLVLLNNRYWLHGREAFVENQELYRELLRLRGSFAAT